MKQTRYALFTDSAPFREGGKGCNVLTENWLAAMGRDVALIVTRRPFPPAMQAGVSQPVRVYWSSHSKGGGRLPPMLQNWLDQFLLVLQLPFLVRALKRARVSVLFAFCGADWRFLPLIRLLAKASGVAFEIYLVDDFESSVRLRGEARLAATVCREESTTLRLARRVWAISPGYAEHLKAKYGVSAAWLPIVIRAPIIPSPTETNPALDVRKIVFIGSVNDLYIDALLDLCDLLAARNATGERWRLVVVTLGTPPRLLSCMAAHPDTVEIVDGSSRVRLEAEMSQAHALFVPYSANPKVSLMIRTSFPTKLGDCLSAGRPILIYGPTESSLVRYSRLNGFPWTATTTTELKTCLDQLTAHEPCPQCYREAVDRWHSPSAIRAILLTA